MGYPYILFGENQVTRNHGRLSGSVSPRDKSSAHVMLIRAGLNPAGAEGGRPPSHRLRWQPELYIPMRARRRRASGVPPSGGGAFEGHVHDGCGRRRKNGPDSSRGQQKYLRNQTRVLLVMLGLLNTQEADELVRRSEPEFILRQKQLTGTQGAEGVSEGSPLHPAGPWS